MDKLIVLNWKSKGTNELCESFIEHIKRTKLNDKLVLCPQNCFLEKFKGLKQSNFYLGAQNCSNEENSLTGEISCKTLKEFNVKYCIIGHSEIRRKYKEAEESIFEKLVSAHENGITPILCIGENIKKELQVLDKVDFNVVVAYEPLWAIGTGRPSNTEDCLRVKRLLKKKHTFLYGGSVTLENYKYFLECEEIDGLLIGKASLKIDILEIAR